MKKILFILLFVFIASCQQKTAKSNSGDQKVTREKNQEKVMSDQQKGSKEDKKLDDKSNFSVIDKFPVLSIYYKGKILKKFDMPSSYEVKNLGYSKIIETKDGFDLVFEWGGGLTLYTDTFCFIKRKDSFYLTKIKTRIWLMDMDDDSTIYYDSTNINTIISPELEINNISLKEIYNKYYNPLSINK